jgi:hypothetical protein
MKTPRARTVVAHRRDKTPSQPARTRQRQLATMDFRDEEIELATLIFRNEEWQQAIAATEAPARKDRP